VRRHFGLTPRPRPTADSADSADSATVRLRTMVALRSTDSFEAGVVARTPPVVVVVRDVPCFTHVSFTWETARAALCYSVIKTYVNVRLGSCHVLEVRFTKYSHPDGAVLEEGEKTWHAHAHGVM
jgi:hypothetical protein